MAEGTGWSEWEYRWRWFVAWARGMPLGYRRWRELVDQQLAIEDAIRAFYEEMRHG